MRKIRHIIGLLLSIALLASALGATAETARGDLAERFGNIQRIEYEGATYSLRNRLTTVLAVGMDADETDPNAAALRAVMSFMLVADDNAKTVTVVELPADTLVQLPLADGSALNIRLRDVYAQGADAEAGGKNLLAALNTLLGEERAEHYLAFDARGAQTLDASLGEIADTKERLKAMMALVEEMSSDQLNDAYALLGDYIITDMKSGAVMKLIDKMDRYTVLPRTLLPGAEYPANDGGVLYVPDVNEVLKLRVETFYEADRYAVENESSDAENR